jgi:hypothetical protein
MAAAMGIQLLTEGECRELQKLGDFDTKTSSWVKTPSNIRRLGGALFCNRRFDTVFVYQNGAESSYAARCSVVRSGSSEGIEGPAGRHSAATDTTDLFIPGSR